jgi:hypothetical protein
MPIRVCIFDACKVLISGIAEPAGQLLPEGLSGWSGAHAPPPTAPGPVAARALMAEARLSQSHRWCA